MPPRPAAKRDQQAMQEVQGHQRRAKHARKRALKKKTETKAGGRRAKRRRQAARRRGQRRGHSAAGVPDASDAGQTSCCPICQETYCQVKFPVVHAPCGHVACAQCSLTWQKKRTARTCSLCRSPVLSVAHCAQLEQLLVPQPSPPPADRGGEAASGAAASSSSSSSSSARQAPAGSASDVATQRSEVKRGLQELSQGDLNFIPGDYRAHLVRAAAHRAVRKGDLTMLETCLRSFKARASTALVCEIAGLWKNAARPVLSLLLAHGAKLDGHAEERPMLHAVYTGNTPMVEALLEMKADATKTTAGESALHVAVRRGRKDVVDILLQHGGRADLPDAAGRTPHFLAEMAWRMHETSCPTGPPCTRCDQRWGIRSRLSELAGGAAPEAHLPRPRPRSGEQEQEEQGEEAHTESEDSSSDWASESNDVSDMDDWASDDFDEDGEEDENEEEEEEDGDEDDDE